MGSSTSKPARKLASQATTTIKASGATSRATLAPSRPAPGASFDSIVQAAVPSRPEPTRKQAEASEEKSAAIMDDAMDPHFMANLAKLGAVKVPRNKLKFKPNDQMLSILAARERETQASSPDFSSATSTHQANRLSAPTLISLLDARKSCRTSKEVEDLAHGYDIDVQVIEDLAKFVNSPSISARPRTENTLTVDNEEEGPAMVDAVWTEPTLSVGSVQAPSNPVR